MHKIISGFCLALIATLSTSVQASNLRDFERGATHPPRHQHHRECYDCSASSVADDFFDLLFGDVFEFFIDGVGHTIAYGGDNSIQRTEGNQYVSRRRYGEPLLPYIRLNVNMQQTEDNLQGLDGKIEIGHGPLALEYRNTHYQDDFNRENLSLEQLQLFYRMSFGRHLGINLGVGSASLSGNNEHSGIVFSSPIILYDQRHVALEIRPSYMTGDNLDITELDASLLISVRRTALRFGYRNLETSDGLTLEGPYAGFDFIF